MSFLKFLGYNKEKIKIKDFLIFFIIILIPNFLRQINYIVAKHVTGLTTFILSPETQTIYTTGITFSGFIEEMIIGLVFAVLWFKFRKLRWFSYGWIGDAVIDFIYVFTWFSFGLVLFSGLSYWTQFFIREILLGYVILGSYMFYKKVKIWKWSLFASIIGFLLVLIFIVF
ncbi:MAG: hypothetical protein ISS82_03765 [Nanoarchaeota archaeon]|nr:hypothetical protein [Nanoarchaeota archaeon]